MAKLSQKPIFICGEGRSGTKLLKDILSKHEDLITFSSESYLFVDSPLHKLKHFDDYDGDNLSMLKAIFSSLMSKNRNKAEETLSSGDFDPEHVQLAEELSAGLKAKEDRFTLIDLACKKLAEKQGATRWIEKTPFHIYYTDKILEEFPDAKIIVNYRDPRAVVASWFKKDENKTLLGVVEAWNRVTNRIEDLHNLPEDLQKHFYFMKYENLILEPEKEIRAICDFVEIDFDDELLNVEVVNQKEDKGRKGFLKEAVNRWQKMLDSNQIKAIELTTMKNRKMLGYEDMPDLPWSLDFPVSFLFELIFYPLKKISKLFKRIA